MNEISVAGQWSSMLATPNTLLPICMFWMGSTISSIEIGCMLSVLRVGHSLTVFSYKRPNDLPVGVQWEDAREILPLDNFVMYRRVNPALGANLFRYRLLQQRKCLWLDTDVLLLKSILFDDREIFGWQDEQLINNAVLHLRPDSPILNDLLDFTSTLYPIPPFFSWRRRLALQIRGLAGSPVHVSDMPWGVWGPNALTHFAKKNSLDHLACERDVFYPIHYDDCLSLVADDAGVIQDQISARTVGIHLWHSTMKRLSSEIPVTRAGASEIEIRQESFFARFCKDHLGTHLQKL